MIPDRRLVPLRHAAQADARSCQAAPVVEDIVTAIGPYAGSVIIGFIGGVVPVIPAEVFVAAIAANQGGVGTAITLALLGVAGQMVATALRFWLGRGVAKLPKGRLEKPFLRAQAKVEQWKDKPLAIIFLSSLLGVPPFYFIAILAGTFGLSFRAIMLVGGAARVIRFVAVALTPSLFGV